MGMVSSTVSTGALRIVWICQKLLDPKYSCIEDNVETTKETTQKKRSSPTRTKSQQTEQSMLTLTQDKQYQQQQQKQIVIAKLNSTPTLNSKTPENNNSFHQENRNRRAQQIRFKTRPSSFDAALIIRAKTKNAVIVTSTPSPLRRQWELTSSSGCSSDSGSNSDSDSETELRVSENVSNEEGNRKLCMSAEEEEAFRLTLGRGHFTRSKKDRFLNHLRLEKRLNDLNKEHFLQRRHSGDLHRII